MTALQKLDETLGYIHKSYGDNEKIFPKELAAIFLYLNKKDSSIDRNAITSYLDKLIEDKHIVIQKMYTGSKVQDYYVLTFNGKVFYESGGYQKELSRSNSKRRLEAVQTWAIVIGTVLAGVYGLWEIIKEIYTCR